jgi:hypothetical protein
MSVLILGGDNINPIKEVLLGLGVNNITHWDARNFKNGSKKQKRIPSKVDMVVMLTNFLNHNAMKHYKNEAKSKELPVVYTTRNVHCVKDDFIKRLNSLSPESPICQHCSQYNNCFK